MSLFTAAPIIPSPLALNILFHVVYWKFTVKCTELIFNKDGGRERWREKERNVQIHSDLL